MVQRKKWPIMHAVGTAFLTLKRYRQKEVHPFGITLKQFYVLRQLKTKETLYPSEIADMLFCDRPTATVVIKNMEKQGWVKRDMDPDDSRRIKVTIESAGQAKLEEIIRGHVDSGEKPFDPFSCFDNREKEQFIALLSKLNQHLKRFEGSFKIQY